MTHAEIIFETGSKSVMSFANEDELKGFLIEHHTRAVQGLEGGPTGHPAERIKQVLIYDDHPADLVPDTVAVETIQTLVQGMEKDDSVDPQQLIAALRDEVSPVYPVDQGRQHSMYKAQESRKLDLGFLNSSSAGGAS